MRRISYARAINEAFHQVMERDECVFVMGQGVNNPWYVGTTAEGLDSRFGNKRVIDPPISENGMNGVLIGAALAGMRPIAIHPRLDFLITGLEQLVNQAANWSYVFNGQVACPIVVRGIINRGGEQGAQHSQAIHAFLMHVPGLKVVMPATPYDAKGLLIAAVEDNNPVIYIDDRWLYEEIGDVPEEPYSVPIGRAAIAAKGKDVTIVAVSYMVKPVSYTHLDVYKRQVEQYTSDERIILDVRPGITDWASIWNADEGAVLSSYSDPDWAYEHIIRPTKLKLQLDYVHHHNLWIDIKLIVYTLWRMVKPNFYPRELSRYPRLISTSRM